ncbi:DEAD/DEAH box helicase [Candidatus Uhrbacteria bacterium]|nr:DEAD/DEAH box helicase [Candidatus Uhrbacteria bacterium]
MTSTTPLEPGFYGLGIAPKLLEILWKLKFKTPTPIQQKSIPIAVEGKDMIGIAQTGTGKTLAYGIPLIQRLAQVKGRGLVILPTRELALQAEETLRQIGYSIGLRTAVLIGGASMHLQIQALRKNPHVLVVTPGRLIDHLEQKTVQLKDIKILVLDEADRMLDMGFAPQIKKILQTVPTDRQTMLFSATMPQEILRIASAYMRLPIQVEMAPSGTMAERVTQELYVVSKMDKIRLLDRILSERRGSILVFTRTKHIAKRITQTIRGMGHTSAEIHSNRSLNQRREALDGFKSGKYRVLVATDIAARGIDVKNIECVVNYDLPDQAEDYVHRIGRTGRAGEAGHAISIATPDQRQEIAAIERFTRSRLPISKPIDLPAARPMEKFLPDPPPRVYQPHRKFGTPARAYGGGGGRRQSFSRRSR